MSSIMKSTMIAGKSVLLKATSRGLRTDRGLKVSVLGAMGGMGQPLSLLLKQSQWFDEVALFDLTSSSGLAMELNQIDTHCQVTAHDGIRSALSGAKIVLNTAGQGWKAGTKAEDFFAANAKCVTETTREVANVCPKAFHVLASAPLNSLVPLAAEVYKQVNGTMEGGRLFGLTGLDTLRTVSVLSDVTGTPPEQISVPVVGGHSATTVVPLLSRSQPCMSLTTDETVRVTRAVQSGCADVIAAREGAGGPVLTAAVAAAQLAEKLAMGLSGHKKVTTTSYVMSSLIPGIRFFASPLELGPTGVQKMLPLPNPLSNYECCLLETAVAFLKEDIEKGIKYACSS